MHNWINVHMVTYVAKAYTEKLLVSTLKCTSSQPDALADSDYDAL